MSPVPLAQAAKMLELKFYNEQLTLDSLSYLMILDHLAGLDDLAPPCNKRAPLEISTTAEPMQLGHAQLSDQKWEMH